MCIKYLGGWKQLGEGEREQRECVCVCVCATELQAEMCLQQMVSEGSYFSQVAALVVNMRYLLPLPLLS